MRSITKIFVAPAILLLLLSLSAEPRLRKPVDPVGFATRSWQMDSIVKRITRLQQRKITEAFDANGIRKFTSWKLAISPHDDYSYAGWVYPAVLSNVKAGTVIILGVAHKAKKFGIEDKMVFDNYEYWQSPYGPVKVSGLREVIMNKLPRSTYMVSDSLMDSEHSVEALIPFLQYYNKNVEIIPILIPPMSYATMKSLAGTLASALYGLSEYNSADLRIGRDFAIVVSSDAVHYGCEGWGGSNYAFYGCDTAGYYKAVAHDFDIIRSSLTGSVTENKVKTFNSFVLSDTNYHDYKWTWCGRYSVPFGLLTLMQLEIQLRSKPSEGVLIGYSTSYAEKPIPVTDLKMGVTAGASVKHWVGFAGVGYR
ncbi:MAG: AmmeMemoRadiSam system protein B [Bacteroidota bacterium]